MSTSLFVLLGRFRDVMANIFRRKHDIDNRETMLEITRGVLHRPQLKNKETPKIGPEFLLFSRLS